jgi:hypothetical protein
MEFMLTLASKWGTLRTGCTGRNGNKGNVRVRVLGQNLWIRLSRYRKNSRIYISSMS